MKENEFIFKPNSDEVCLIKNFIVDLLKEIKLNKVELLNVIIDKFKNVDKLIIMITMLQMVWDGIIRIDIENKKEIYSIGTNTLEEICKLKLI